MWAYNSSLAECEENIDHGAICMYRHNIIATKIQINYLKQLMAEVRT